MPAPTSPNPEWIELYNPTNTPVDLTGWHVDDVENGGSAPQALTGIVAAHEYFLFEFKSAIFNNSGDDVRLLDPTDTVVSETSYTTSSSSDSWGRDRETLLFCAQVPTPGVTNTTSCTTLAPTGTPSPTTIPLTPSPLPSIITPSPPSAPTSTPTPTPTPVSHTTTASVFISEFLPRPATGGSEWVELYNDSSTTVSLDGWYIDDIAGGGSSPKQISASIAPHNYATIQLTSAILNNDTDSVRLLNPQQESIDELKYEDAEVDVSFSRHNFVTDTVCKTMPTPGEENNSCIDALTDATTQDAAITSTPAPVDTITDNTIVTTTSTQSSASVNTPAIGDIQGISTYRPIVAQVTAHQPTKTETPPVHTRSRIAFAIASMTSSGAALLLFFRKIKPW